MNLEALNIEYQALLEMSDSQSYAKYGADKLYMLTRLREEICAEKGKIDDEFARRANFDSDDEIMTWTEYYGMKF